MSDAIQVITGIFAKPGIPKPEYANFMAIGIAMIILFAKEFSDEYQWRLKIAESRSWIVRHIYIVLMVAYIILFGVLGSDQFIYFQF